ncbi:MAG TPA: methyltransferase domain-containing protein [Allosphingosinicella sp.]|jgi:SAM-dependent methyltransferase
MASRPFLRAMFVGAGVALAAVAGVAVYRHSTVDPAPQALPPDFDPGNFARGRQKLDAPYVVTDYDVVDAMLSLAEVRPNEYVIDLGTGDGRIPIAAAKSSGARGLGVDIDPARVREAQQNARAAGVAHRVEFRRQNLFDTPLADADVVTLYLTPEVNARLRPRILEQMRAGTRVVSHDFDMGDWTADRRVRIGSASVYLWIVPARVGGRWTLTVDGRPAELQLDQLYQQVRGSVRSGGRISRVEQGVVSGPRIRFIASVGGTRRVFEGRADGDTIVPTDAGAGWRAVRAD